MEALQGQRIGFCWEKEINGPPTAKQGLSLPQSQTLSSKYLFEEKAWDRCKAFLQPNLDSECVVCYWVSVQYLCESAHTGSLTVPVQCSTELHVRMYLETQLSGCNDSMHINRSDFHCAAIMLAVLIYSQCNPLKQAFMD